MLTQQLSALASEHGLPDYTPVANILQGAILMECGELERGRALLTTGLSQYRATQRQLFLPFFLSFLAEATLRQGQIEEGLATVTEALRLTETNLDRFWEAETYRLKGELLLQSGVQSLESRVKKSPKFKVQSPKSAKTKSQILNSKSQEEAEACFLQAIAIAQQQGAKSLELRAVMSLARLWQQQGKTAEAHKLLFEIYHWFTEGFDTKDLREAKILLEELS